MRSRNKTGKEAENLIGFPRESVPFTAGSMSKCGYVTLLGVETAKLQSLRYILIYSL
jgi:hypothetical protein